MADRRRPRRAYEALRWAAAGGWTALGVVAFVDGRVLPGLLYTGLAAAALIALRHG